MHLTEHKTLILIIPNNITIKIYFIIVRLRLHLHTLVKYKKKVMFYEMIRSQCIRTIELYQKSYGLNF